MTLHIGITLGLYSADESLWTNGIKQNALALARTFKASLLAHRVTLVNTTPVPITPALPWDLSAFDTQAFEAVKDSLDVLILLGGQLADAPSAALRARGVKLVGYKCGSEAVVSAQSIVYGLPETAAPYYNRHLHALWLIPQIAQLNAAYYQVLHRCEHAIIVPFVWHPAPLESACQALPNQGVFVPHASIAKRLCILEPNRELLKTFLHPLLIAELFYRNFPQRVASVRITNLAQRSEHSELNGVLKGTDLHREGKIILDGRHHPAAVLPQHTDVVISHQWGNPLNYAYLETAWLGYPLVHNASLCPELGFYYEGFELIEAAQMLGKASVIGQTGGSYVIGDTPESAVDYRRRQRLHIKRFIADQAQLVAQYDELLAQLMAID